MKKMPPPLAATWHALFPPAVTVSAAALAERYQAEIFRYAVRRVGDSAEAEDITAEVFAAVLAQPGRVPKASPKTHSDDDLVRAYLIGIARRKVTDTLRKRSRHPQEPLSHELAQNHSLAESTEKREGARELRKLLDALPTDWREVLLLKYVEELSLREIAASLGRSEKAVNSLLQRARAEARKRGKNYFSLWEETK
jgi:RNA polymerase sigma-70 factor, ECF subfamily